MLNHKFKSPMNKTSKVQILTDYASPGGSIGKQSFTQRFDLILDTLKQKAIDHGLVTPLEI